MRHSCAPSTRAPGWVKPGTRADWGGYSGYFADPDGHLWEAAFAPGFRVFDGGTIDIHP